MKAFYKDAMLQDRPPAVRYLLNLFAKRQKSDSQATLVQPHRSEYKTLL